MAVDVAVGIAVFVAFGVFVAVGVVPAVGRAVGLAAISTSFIASGR